MSSRERPPGDERLRILLVNRKVLPTIGGIQICTDLLATGLEQEGAEVKVLATVTPPPPDQPDISYPVVYSPDFKEEWCCVKDSSVVHFNAFSWRVWLFARLLRKPMIFVYHDAGDRLCARALNWRFWQRYCGFHPLASCNWCKDIPFYRSPRHWLLKPLQQRMIDRMDEVISPGKWILGRLPRHARSIANGIDLDKNHPIDNPTRDYFLFVGRLVTIKGPDLLVRAVAECQTRGQAVRLVLVGDGPLRKECESLARRLGIAGRVEFMGQVDRESTLPYYQNAAALVIPSVFKEDMFPTVALEAMACKTPVIASSLGGLKETVGKAGLVFPAGDVSALADQIQRLSGDAALASDLAEKGYQLVRESYQRSRMIQQYIMLYRKLARQENMPATNNPGD